MRVSSCRCSIRSMSTLPYCLKWIPINEMPADGLWSSSSSSRSWGCPASCRPAPCSRTANVIQCPHCWYQQWGKATGSSRPCTRHRSCWWHRKVKQNKVHDEVLPFKIYICRNSRRGFCPSNFQGKESTIYTCHYYTWTSRYWAIS